MNGDEISLYKRKIMKHLISDPDIHALVDVSSKYQYADDMLYELIFPFNRVHTTEQEVSVYICVMIDVHGTQRKNDMVRNVTLKIRVYCHEDLMQVKGQGGDRIDLVSARIDHLLNESFDFGIGKVGITSNTEHVLDSRHFYREMIFKTDALNNKRETVNAWSR